jgi:hypothetical protein
MIFRATVIAGTIWLGGQTATLPAFVVAQVSGGESPAPITSLLLSALGSSPAPLILAWVVTRGDKERSELRAELMKEREENRRLNERAIDSAKEMTTMLERTAATLSEVKSGMDASVDRTFRDLKDILQDYSRGRGREP